jgi:hypothetical protein
MLSLCVGAYFDCVLVCIPAPVNPFHGVPILW